MKFQFLTKEVMYANVRDQNIGAVRTDLELGENGTNVREYEMEMEEVVILTSPNPAPGNF